MKKYSFHKKERLCNKSIIDTVFHNGSCFVMYPFRIIYLIQNKSSSPSVQLLISVSKRRFKSAVDRNRLKRLIREAYRLEKSELSLFTEQAEKEISFVLQYIAKKEEPITLLREKVKLISQKLIDEFNLEQSH